MSQKFASNDDKRDRTLDFELDVIARQLPEPQKVLIMSAIRAIRQAEEGIERNLQFVEQEKALIRKLLAQGPVADEVAKILNKELRERK